MDAIFSPAIADTTREKYVEAHAPTALQGYRAAHVERSPRTLTSADIEQLFWEPLDMAAEHVEPF